MAYQITKSDGTLLLQLADGFTDSVSSSITFVGKNVSKFGEIQNNDLLHLLENFASTTEPANKLTGQLWFDKSNNTLKVYNQTQWQTLSVLAYGASSSAAASPSNLWYDSVNNQLFINNGSGFTLIGPEKAPGYNPTKLISVTLKDTSDATHPVIEALVDDQVIYVVSGSDFVTSSTNLIPGISHIYKGITLKNGDVAGSTDATLTGTSLYATNAGKLLNATRIGYISAEFIPPAGVASIVQRSEEGEIQATTVYASAITPTGIKGTLNSNWGISGNFTPTNNGSSTLGISSLRWNTIWAQTVDSTTVNANSVKFTSLTDLNLLSILQFDDDPKLAANSHQRLPTQYAVKTYVDTTATWLYNLIETIPKISVPAESDSLVHRDGDGGIAAANINAVSIKLTASSPTINYLDADTALAANSDARLATQKAIKAYIDSRVATEINSRIAGDANLQSQIDAAQGLPSGTVLYTAGSTAPTGFLEANGQTLLKASYPALFAAIGGTYGSSSTTFNLPDLRGQFVRGWDHGKGVDPGRTLGSAQGD